MSLVTCHSSLVTALEIDSSSQPALPITDAGDCGRPDRWSEGCAPLVTVLPPFLLVTRHSPLVTAREIASSSNPALPITDAGECGRPDGWSEGCAPLVTVLPPFLLVTRHLSLVTAFEIASSSNPALPITDAGDCGRPNRWSEGCAPLVTVLPPFLLVTRHSPLVTAREIASSSNPALPITDAGECGRPDRWSEGCAPLVTVLPPFLLVTRHSPLVTAREIASSSNPALPITDAGECGRPDG